MKPEIDQLGEADHQSVSFKESREGHQRIVPRRRSLRSASSGHVERPELAECVEEVGSVRSQKAHYGETRPFVLKAS